ncbi:MAG: hypothetical protein GEEBNDBF_02581 [bacterium]|nr:hypothetical protein [bacterium]
MKRSLLAFGVPLLLVALLAMLVVRTDRERKRGHTRLMSATVVPTTMQVALVPPGGLLLKLTDPDLPPALLAARYPRRQFAALPDGRLLTAYLALDQTTVAFGTATATRREPVTSHPEPGPVVGQVQPSVIWTHGASADESPRTWVAVREMREGQSQVTVFRGAPGDAWQSWSIPDSALPGTPTFPILATNHDLVMLVIPWTDNLGASGIQCFTADAASVEFVPGPGLRRSSDWQTWQPPDVRIGPAGTTLLTLRAEAPPRVESSQREVDSAVLAWRFDWHQTPPDSPEILMPVIPGQFTERPVAAVDAQGGWAVAIGHWGPPQAGELRGYDLTVLVADGPGPWREVASPLSSITGIATAQPQLARSQQQLLLVYALDANEIVVPDAHQLQWTRSSDTGATWSTPAVLMGDYNAQRRDYPLDLAFNGTQASVLFQRQIVSLPEEGSGSIQVAAPQASMWGLTWPMTLAAAEQVSINAPRQE